MRTIAIITSGFLLCRFAIELGAILFLDRWPADSEEKTVVQVFEFACVFSAFYCLLFALTSKGAL